MKKRNILSAFMAALAITMLPGSLPKTTAAESVQSAFQSVNSEVCLGESSAQITRLSADKSNAPDLSSVKIKTSPGQTLVYDKVSLTNAKSILLFARVLSGTSDIKIYADETKEDFLISTIPVSKTTTSNDPLDFETIYGTIQKNLSGTHKIYFVFSGSCEIEMDWFKFTSYTGTESEAQKSQRMQWWRDAKFGQFIHYGAYSYLGGSYNGKKTTHYAEWIKHTLKISKEDYAKNVTPNFNPDKFDAEKIVSDAKKAGQKYIVITSRHHEGFSIFDTKTRNFKNYSLFSVANHGQYKGPDILKSLSEECKKQGIPFGVYTTILDWNDPSQEDTYKTDQKTILIDNHTKEAYKSQLEGQIKELIENYGTKIFFFDGEWVDWWTKEDGQEMYRYILSLDETCIVNNRVGKRQVTDGDYGTPEQEIPPTGLDYDWESCVTMNNNWGYYAGDNNWKSPQWIINNLLDIGSKGGNLLLNVGPDGSGVVEQAAIDRMSTAGKWLERFGEALYGTRANCFSTKLNSNLRITTKTEGSKGYVYVSLLEKDPAALGKLTIPALLNEIQDITELSTGKSVPFKTSDDEIALSIGSTTKQDYATVYKISVDGKPLEKKASARTNLAAGKSASDSSHYDADHTAAKLVDGSKDNTRWAPSADQKEPPYAIIDLGDKKEIGEIALYEWMDSDLKKYRCSHVEISVSNDETTWTELYRGNEIGAQLKVKPAALVEARYIKIHNIEKIADAKEYPSIYEVEVFGPSPSVTITEKAEKYQKMPFTLSGTYLAGTKAEIQVWSLSSPAFLLPVSIHEEKGAWSATIQDSRITDGTYTFTIYLKDATDQIVAMDSFTADYMEDNGTSSGGNTPETPVPQDPVVTPAPVPEPEPAPAPAPPITLPVKGEKFEKNKLTYKITASTNTKKTVTVEGLTVQSQKTVRIPATVKFQNYTYKVTSVSKNAFKANKKIKTVFIGKNITVIGKNAFYKNSSLKKIVIQGTSLKKAGRNAFAKIHPKARLTAPKKKFTSYQKLLKL